MQKIAEKTFLLTPRNVEVSAEEKARLIEKGFFNRVRSRRSRVSPLRAAVRAGPVGAGAPPLAQGLAGPSRSRHPRERRAPNGEGQTASGERRVDFRP